jgi:hypothetical protein
MLGELRNVDPARVEVGMLVRATYIDFPANEVAPAWTLYAWEPAALARHCRGWDHAARAQAVRRSDLHCFRRRSPPRLAGRAPRPGKVQAKESKDIFVNILTDTGLVQRYITDWAGPNAVIKSIGLCVPWSAYDTLTFPARWPRSAWCCRVRRQSSASARISPRSPAAASFHWPPRRYSTCSITRGADARQRPLA